MPTNVVMPQMGESIAEGTIVRWIKKVGDRSIATSRCSRSPPTRSMRRIPSPAAGVLAEIKVKEGETVPVDSVVAVIGGCRRGDDRGSRQRAQRRGRARTDRRRDALPSAGGRSAGSVRRRRSGSEDDADGRRGAAVDRVTTAAEVVAARAPDRQGAQRRHPPDPGHGHRRPRDQAATSSATSRRARSGAGAGRAARRPVDTGVQRRARASGRADERDAPEDRRAHGAQRAHVAARVLGLRGRLRARGRAARSAEGEYEPPAPS